MNEKVIFTVKKQWVDTNNGITFETTDEHKGKRTVEGIVVTGESNFTHLVPWEFVNEQYLNPANEQAKAKAKAKA